MSFSRGNTTPDESHFNRLSVVCRIGSKEDFHERLQQVSTRTSRAEHTRWHKGLDAEKQVEFGVTSAGTGRYGLTPACYDFKMSDRDEGSPRSEKQKNIRNRKSLSDTVTPAYSNFKANSNDVGSPNLFWRADTKDSVYSNSYTFDDISNTPACYNLKMSDGDSDSPRQHPRVTHKVINVASRPSQSSLTSDSEGKSKLFRNRHASMASLMSLASRTSLFSRRSLATPVCYNYKMRDSDTSSLSRYLSDRPDNQGHTNPVFDRDNRQSVTMATPMMFNFKMSDSDVSSVRYGADSRDLIFGSSMGYLPSKGVTPACFHFKMHDSDVNSPVGDNWTINGDGQQRRVSVTSLGDGQGAANGPTPIEYNLDSEETRQRALLRPLQFHGRPSLAGLSSSGNSGESTEYSTSQDQPTSTTTSGNSKLDSALSSDVSYNPPRSSVKPSEQSQQRLEVKENELSQADFHLIRVSIVASVSYFVCWFPWICVAIVTYYHGYTHFLKILLRVTLTFGYIAAATVPYAFGLGNKHVTSAFTNIRRRFLRYCQVGHQEQTSQQNS
ncbi:uncharacterized protein [Ptychodera flava]|uniref:uncharacterized protein n=1 Tax=Ptychodera flava TaxID=63121 RepID=UPI003969EE63